MLVCLGAGEKSRTPDLRITNALLYQLSYTGEPGILAKQPRSAASPGRYFSSNGGSFLVTATFFSVTYCGIPSLYFG